jgi:hypothetical protein
MESFLIKLHHASTDRDRLDLVASSIPHSIASVVKRGERSHEEPASELEDRFEGLKMEADGRISFHGSTSFFQFPSTSKQAASSPSSEYPPAGLDARERLTRNAWQQRVFEKYANVPVSSHSQHFPSGLRVSQEIC